MSARRAPGRSTRAGRAPRLEIALPGALVVAIAAVAVPLLSCTTPEQLLHFTVEGYLASVQQRNDAGIANLWGPFRRETAGLSADEAKQKMEEFSKRIAQAQRAFEEAKHTGELVPDPLGIAMFRALGLGKGAVSLPAFARVNEGGETATVRTKIATNLETLNLNGLPDGVRVYLPGYPFGRLEMVAVGFDEPGNHHLLGSVEIDFTLSRATEKMPGPAGWLVESIAPDPASAVEWAPRAKSKR